MKWENLTLLDSYKKLQGAAVVDVKAAMAGENGAKRVKEYCVPMSNGMVYNFAAKQVDDDILAILQEFADEAELTEKYAALYNGEVINTGEKRLVLHQLCRGQLGEDVIADGLSRRELRNLQIKFMQAKLPMKTARNSRLSARSVSAAATSARALCTSLLRAGQKSTIH